MPVHSSIQSKMEANAHVTKSKSSNKAITTKPDENKRNAAVQPHVLKKRGVYVENKFTNLSILSDTNNKDKRTIKLISKPRPGSKKFLESVLTILSKSSTGTQYPDEQEKEMKLPIKSKPITRKAETSRGFLDNPSKSKLNKFRSKVLNNIDANSKTDKEQILVLKSKKDIIETPSNYSETNSFRLPKVSSFVQTNNNINLLKNDLDKKADGVEKEREKNIKTEKKIRIEDPVTLVENTDEKQQIDKLYDIFVDLLETTFSANNVKDKFTELAITPSAVSSDYNLEIDETVLRKLDVKNELFDDVTQKASSQICCVKKDNLGGKKLSKIIKNTSSYKQKYPLKPKRSPISVMKSSISSKLKTQSFTYPNNKHTVSKTSKKKNILNEFKEQLKMDLEFKEPQNWYQTLKVMAKNKRNNQKAHFSAPIKYNDDECMLKRRRIIFGTTKLNRKKRQDVDNLKPTTSKNRNIDNINSRKCNIALKKDDSYQSLEVYGYDYVSSKSKHAVFNESILSPYHSSSGESQINIDALLKYTESDFSKSMRSISHNLEFYTNNK